MTRTVSRTIVQGLVTSIVIQSGRRDHRVILSEVGPATLLRSPGLALDAILLTGGHMRALLYAGVIALIASPVVAQTPAAKPGSTTAPVATSSPALATTT